MLGGLVVGLVGLMASRIPINKNQQSSNVLTDTYNMILVLIRSELCAK